MVDLVADHHFHIGSLHLRTGMPCQDYALSGIDRSSTFAIISDGCSKGGYTDMGSRLISFATATALREYEATRHVIPDEAMVREINMHQRIFLGGIRQSLKLNTRDMLATCGYAYMGSDGGFIHLRGDGVIARAYVDGTIDASSFSWGEGEKNAPFYPAYLDDGCAEFIDFHGGDLGTPTLLEECARFNPEKGWERLESKKYTIEEGIAGITIFISREEIEKNLAYVAVFSDGVNQVGSKDPLRSELLSWTDVITSMLSIKSKHGAFAKRRMIRFLKELQEKGKAPLDDIAYAVIQVARES